MSETAAESLHRNIFEAYGDLGMVCIEACGQWIIGIDATVEPPYITLDNIDAGVGYALDGDLIYARLDSDTMQGDETHAFFVDAKTEAEALQHLKELFGGN